MSFLSDFKKGLGDAISEITELDQSHLFYSHTNGPEPSGLYCSMNILNIDQVVGHSTSTLASNEQLRILTVYEATVKFSFYGKQSQEACSEFDFGLNNVVNIETLLKKDISVMRKGQVVFAPDKRDTKWIDRYTLTVTFAFAAYVHQDVDVIESIEYTDYLGKVHTIP